MYVVEDPNATAQSEETKLPASAKSKITHFFVVLLPWKKLHFLISLDFQCYFQLRGKMQIITTQFKKRKPVEAVLWMLVWGFHGNIL